MTPRLTKPSPRAILGAYALAGALFGSACAPGAADGEASAKTADLMPASALRVEVATLARSEAHLDLTVPGEIRGWRDANLSAALGGYVESVKVKVGDRVRAGQVIALVDAEIHRASVDRAQAQLAQAEAEARRLTVMGDLATGQQRNNADTQVILARAGLAQAEAQLRRAVITAPFSGRIASVGVEAGEVAGPGLQIARLVQLDPVKVTLSVPDRDVVALTEGMEVQVSTNAIAGTRTGIIRHLGTAANLSTRAFEVEVEVANPDERLLPGMIAQVRADRIVAEDTLVIPQDWLVTRRSDQGVFVEVDGVARWRTVTLGDVVRDQVIVASGIAEGDRLVVTGHRDLVDGDKLILTREGRCCDAGRVAW